MKRFLITGLLALAVVQLATGQISSTFNNQAGATYQIPPQPGTIDATNFVNAGTFNVNIPLDIIGGDALYYSTSDTLNYTNTGTMIGTPGFNFGFFPTYYIPPVPNVPFNKMAANFVNRVNGASGGVINCAPSLLGFGGNTEFMVAATNIVNSGAIVLNNSGLTFFILGGGTAAILGGGVSPALISLTGENVDLSGGTLAFASSGNFTNATFGVSSLDSGVGTDTNGEWNPSSVLLRTSARSSLFATVRLPAPFFQNMFLFNSTPYAESLTGVPVGTNLVVWRSIFLQDTSPPGVTKNVYFDSSFVGTGALHVEWGGTFIDPVTGLLTTNYLYLSDVPADLTATSVTNIFFTFNGVPQNYTFAESTTRLLNPANAASPGLAPIVPGFATNFYSYLSLQLIPTLTSTNNIFGASITNMPERIQISASRTLNLTGAQLAGPDYLSLKSTNQFDGNVGVSISAPFSDISLGVTNGFLSISNLVRPLLPRWSGTIQAFTARWFAEDPAVPGVTNDYRVLLVNSQVFPTTVPVVQDLTLHATNSLTLSDSLNVSRNLSIDATSLTLTTNGSGAMSPSGQLNFTSSSILWSPSLPNLKYLTNWGIITAGNTIFFAGNMSSPYSDPNAATPYQSFVNHGVVTNQGSFIVANYFLNDGVFQNNPSGNFTLRAQCAFLTNGIISAPAGAGNVSIACNSLVVSNHSIQSGATLKLSVTNCITDGYALFNQFGHTTTTNAPTDGGVTNGNFWTAGGSFSTTFNPMNGDLLATTVSNSASSLANFNFWAGQDRGCAPTGYVNNLAIGRLILDGTTGGQFTFTGIGSSNALYVDLIEFQGSATNRDVANNLASIHISPNMRIYYAQAIAGGISIAEKLAGLNNGRFCWVSNYAGIFSSTNIQYPDGSWHTLNKALVASCNIDSRLGTIFDDALHTPNCSSSAPIPTDWIFDNVATYDPCDCDAGTGSGSGSGSGGSGGSGGPSSFKSLSFPVQASIGAGSSNLFTLGKVSYNGLFYETNVVIPRSAGYFNGVVNPDGSFSAYLLLGGHKYLPQGKAKFDPSGSWSGTMKYGSDSLSATMRLDLAGGGQITGQITNGQWSAQLLALRGYDQKLHPAPQQGQYTIVLPGENGGGANNPSGHGFGKITIKPDGGVTWTGTLADGSPVSQSSVLSGQGVWPLYAPLYSGAGFVISWIQFTHRSDSDLSGLMIWMKPAGMKGSYFKSGFTNEMETVGSRYTPPPLNSNHGVVVLTGGNLSVPVTNYFIFGAGYKASNKANKFNLAITPSTGWFNGNYGSSQFKGALIQNDGIGAGYFLGTNESGQVWFSPTP
jgi:hypothetical protein